MIRPLIVTAMAAFLALPAFASDKEDIEKLMAGYHEAVVAHDGEKVKSFFLPQGTAWFTVVSASHKLRPGSYQDFASFVSTTKSALDPRHTELELRSDGTVATVWFRFQFMIDGKEENRGHETWQLVKTEQGWRIAALSYSSDPAS